MVYIYEKCGIILPLVLGRQTQAICHESSGWLRDTPENPYKRSYLQAFSTRGGTGPEGDWNMGACFRASIFRDANLKGVYFG